MAARQTASRRLQEYAPLPWRLARFEHAHLADAADRLAVDVEAFPSGIDAWQTAHETPADTVTAPGSGGGVTVSNWSSASPAVRSSGSLNGFSDRPRATIPVLRVTMPDTGCARCPLPHHTKHGSPAVSEFPPSGRRPEAETRGHEAAPAPARPPLPGARGRQRPWLHGLCAAGAKGIAYLEYEGEGFTSSSTTCRRRADA